MPINNKNTKKHIAIIATGGTIAAQGPNATALGDYTVDQPIEALLTAIPSLNELAHLSSYELCNIDSRNMNAATQHALIALVEQLLAKPHIDGVVITHGTDTLEDTALLLHWCIKSPKPVVMTGAMRPATALSADGTLNLYHAVLLASHAQAQGLGTVALLNDEIFSGRFVQKLHTSQPSAFNSMTTGAMGLISQGEVIIHTAPQRPFGANNALCLPENPQAWPQVDILYDHVDANPALYTASVESGAQAVIIAALGHGSLSPAAREGAMYAAKNGVICVRASRIPDGPVMPSSQDEQYQTLPAYHFTANAARNLTALALANGASRDELAYYLRYY